MTAALKWGVARVTWPLQILAKQWWYLENGTR